MTDGPTIPFGYRQVTGQLQKGDGVWNGERFVRVKRQPTEVVIRKTKMLYPCAMPGEAVAIRKCEVVQTEIPDPDRLDKSLLFPLPGVPAVESMEVE